VAVRRIGVWLAGTVVALVLLFSYRTSTSGASGDESTIAGDPTGGGGTVVSTGPPNVVDGSVAHTRWGQVQVELTIAGGKIVDATVLRMPDGNSTDRTINASALPRLRQEVLSTQGGRIDGVSGATVTSDGYRESLQAALDAVHFGQ
jgi:FMN-binding domain